MHILVLPSWYPTKADPIRGSFFAEQAEALSRCGHRVSVIALYGDAPSGHYVEENWRGEATEYALHFKPLPLHLSFFRILSAMRELFADVFDHDRPDLIHVHSFNAIRYARALKKLYRIPFVVTEHVSWFERGLLSERDKRAIAADYNAADALIAVSTGLAEQIQPLCRQKVRVVPNLVGERFFLSPLERRGEGFSFLSVGSLNRNKGMDAVIAAFAEVHSVCPETNLVIAGDGEERDALRTQTETLGLEESVRFCGQVSREKCAELYTQCGAFVLASRVETFGIVLAEAMASGRPVVMTKTGAWRQIVSRETGRAVEIDDIPALSRAMIEVAQDRTRYDPAAIRAYCRDHFSETAVCRNLTEIYEEVLRNA